MKGIFIFLVLLLVPSTLCSSGNLLSVTPVTIVNAQWGDGINEFAYVNEDIVSCSEAFGADRDGYVYIEDMHVYHNRIVKFDMNGRHIENIQIREPVGSPDIIKFDSQKNIILSAPVFILKAGKNGSTIFIKKYKTWRKMEFLNEFLIIADHIIIQTNEGDFIEMADGNEKKYQIATQFDIYKKELGLDPAFQLEKGILFINDVFISRSIYKLKQIYQEINKSQEKIKSKKEDYEPFDYSFTTIPDSDIPYFLGVDKHFNTYWFSFDEKDFSWIIIIYDKNGRTLGWFTTAGIGDIVTSVVKPYVDYHGNVYLMQRWSTDGIKILKYEREW